MVPNVEHHILTIHISPPKRGQPLYKGQPLVPRYKGQPLVPRYKGQPLVPRYKGQPLVPRYKGQPLVPRCPLYEGPHCISHLYIEISKYQVCIFFCQTNGTILQRSEYSCWDIHIITMSLSCSKQSP